MKRMLNATENCETVSDSFPGRKVYYNQYNGVDTISFIMNNSSTRNNGDNAEEENQEQILCVLCNSVPCLWKEYGKIVLEGCIVWESIGLRNTSREVKNRKCRYYCYKEFTRHMHGSLGKGNRIQLPRCIQDKIREKFPNKSSRGYVGFSEHAK